MHDVAELIKTKAEKMFDRQGIRKNFYSIRLESIKVRFVIHCTNSLNHYNKLNV